MKKHLLLIVLVVIIGSLPCFLQYGDYLLMDDFFRQEIPFIMETKRMFSSGIPFWSWNTFFGDNFISSYGFYTLTSPFVWFNCLFPYKWLVHSLFLTLVLKYICTYLASRMFFRKMDVSEVNANIGGLLYAFSSYAISNSFYYHFFEPMIIFPILLVAIERFLRREEYNKTTLVLAAFLTVFINYYFAICSFIAAAMYVFCRIAFNKDRILLLKRAPLGILLIIIGILIDSFLLFPTASHLSGGARATQGILTGLDFTAVPFFIERLRTLFMLQPLEETTTLFQGTGFNSCSVTLPVLGIFLVFAYCWNYKRSWITGLIIVSLIAFLTPINTIFSLFTNPNYTRWAYALTLFLILASVKWMDLSQNKNPIALKSVFIYSFIAIGVFLFALWRGNGIEESINKLQFGAYTFLLFISLACLVAFVYTSFSKQVLLAGILICATFQMAIFNILRSDIGFSLASKKESQGMVKRYLVDKKMDRMSDDNFMRYRTAFEARYPNLGLLTNRPSVSTFHSVLNTNLYQFVTIADTANVIFLNAFVPNYYRRSFYALMSVKECVVYHDSLSNRVDEKMNYTRKSNSPGFTLYQNNDFIPMGFTYDTFISENTIDSLKNMTPQPDVPKVLLSHLVVPSSDKTTFAKLLKEANKVDLNANIDSIVACRQKYCSMSFEGTTSGFTSKIYLPKDNFVFYSVPADKGFSAYVDGIEVPIYKVNLGLSAISVPKGLHNVFFEFLPAGLKEGVVISVLSLLLLIIITYKEVRSSSNFYIT